MTVYQIHVKGETDCVDSEFKCSSKKVYKHKPNEEEINNFIESCSKGYFFNLNVDKPYETFIVELELID